MSIFFSVMIMWVLYCNGLCPFGLALGYTIPVGICVILKAFFPKKED